jgi:O-antigen biosynthesis protein WbqP
MLKPFRQRLEEGFKMYLRFGKRLFDISASLMAAIFLLPLLLVAALLIKVFDPGPVIFRQNRIGRKGKVFEFYKFRSMPINTGDIPSDQVGTIKLTWIGQLIRRTNIDELPQLFNILIGDMSVVGPRPAILSQQELINQRKENGSILCRPGLTGLAQISSFDGMSIYEKSMLDSKYANSISFKNDLLIVIKTFSYLLKSPPVY